MKKLMLSLIAALHIFSIYTGTDSQENLNEEISKIYFKRIDNFNTAHIPKDQKTEVDSLIDNVYNSLNQCFQKNNSECDNLLTNFEKFNAAWQERRNKELQTEKNELVLEGLRNMTSYQIRRLNKTRVEFQKLKQLVQKYNQASN